MAKTKAYEKFLKTKIEIAHPVSPELAKLDLGEGLFRHQEAMAKWMLSLGRGLLAASFGLGKCHGAGTKIMMSDGSEKNVEDVAVGDKLMGDDSKPRNVLSLANGEEMLYRITLKNGDSYTCNESHIFALQMSNKHNGNQMGDRLSMPLTEFIELPEYAQRNCYKHYKVAVDFEAQDVPCDPYLYGVWLGDGHQGSLEFTINNLDTEIVDYIQQFAENKGCNVSMRDGQGCKTIRIIRRLMGHALHIPEFYFIQDSSVCGEKVIDRRFLINSRESRLALLAGIIDTDGYNADKCFDVASKWRGFRDEVVFLARSLGFSAHTRSFFVDGTEYFHVTISGDTHLIPCLTRKKAGERLQIKNPLVYGFTVEPIGVGEYFGFEIDGNHQYLLGDFTVTHNTRVQCAVAKALHQHTGQKFLLVCPLGVRHQFQKQDGPVLGLDWQYCRTDAEIEAATSPYIITNYERVRDGGIIPAKHNFCGASLDEGSLLRSLGSKTSNEFHELFAEIPHRWVCTATPSPNNFREIIYYADFLGIMDKGQILTRFFQRNPDKAGDLTLNPTSEEEYWLWVASWALFLFLPSDIGFDDAGYELPELNIHWHCVDSDHSRAEGLTDNRGQSQLFVSDSSSISVTAKENHATLKDRLAETERIVLGCGSKEQLIVWCHFDEEQRGVERMLKAHGITYSSVFGSLAPEESEKRLFEWLDRKTTVLIGKPQMLGSGCNLQYNSHTAIFTSPTFRFHDEIQAIHRIYRFQQEVPVEIHFIYAESQQSMVRSMKQKWSQHNELTERMREIMKQHGLSHEALTAELTRKIGIEREERKGLLYTLALNDTVLETPLVESDSVHLIHTSVPFGNQYEYGINVEDFGHNKSNEEYHHQMDFLIPELFRILKPGRIAAIHAKDRIRYGWQTKSGVMEVEPFSDDTVAAFRKHGFMYEGRRTIVTDVVRENNSTYRLGYTEMCKDASKMGSGLPEYLLLFRKPPTDVSTAYADEPVTKEKSEYSLARWQIDAASFWASDGKHLEAYDYDAHIARLEERSAAGLLPTSFCAEPARSNNPDVWTNLNFMQCLNNRQVASKQIKHLCPLPTDLVKRVITLYSAKGELVYDPFSGLGTVPYMAVILGRRGYGVELHPDYFYDSVSYLREAEETALAPTLFEEETV